MDNSILAINTSFQEMDHLASALAGAGMLSSYVRPYTNQHRIWERALASLPTIGEFYQRTFSRRCLPDILDPAYLSEAGVFFDFAMAAAARIDSDWALSFAKKLMHARTRAVARAGARLLLNQKAVVSSWGCAAPAFQKMKKKGGLNVLNYPLAHHRFTLKLLLEEAERVPAFANTLNSHDFPPWLTERMDAEITMADRIFVGSTFVRDSFTIEGICKEKIDVIPYGADTNLFRSNINIPRRSDALNLLFVGQIGQRKGLSYLLEAYQKFKGPHTSLTLVGKIQGNGTALAPYQNFIKHINHVPKTRLPKIYQQADVFVFPTLVEGMPIVVLEAMASGLPVITTPNGPGDIVRDGVDGFLVPARDTDAIIERLDLLRQNHELRMVMGRNARERALTFTWEAYQRKALSLLKTLIGAI